MILSCWAQRYLEGNRMRTRSGKQYTVNVRPPEVICAVVSGVVLVSGRQDASQSKSSTHHGPNLMLGYLNREFFMICVNSKQASLLT